MIAGATTGVFIVVAKSEFSRRTCDAGEPGIGWLTLN